MRKLFIFTNFYGIILMNIVHLLHEKERIFLKLKRLFSLLLSVLMIAGLSTVCLTASAAETETAATGVKMGSYYNVDYLEDKAYSGTDLGSTYTPSNTTWKVWSPDATKIQLKLFATGSDMESGAKSLGKYDMKKNSSTGV